MPPPAFAILLPVASFLALWALAYLTLAGVVRVLKMSAKSGSAWLERSPAAKWTMWHSGPIGSYAPILLVIAVGAVAALAAGYLFVYLAEHLERATSLVSRTDYVVHTWFGNERQASMTTLFTAATDLGGTLGQCVIVAVVMAASFVRKQRASAIFLLVTAGVGALLNLGLKMIFERVRPDLAQALVAARWYSFPSGHAMDSFITFGALAYLALRLTWPWVAKSATLAAALTAVVLVGVSRVYLGVHWASDVIGGWAAGTVWLAAAVVAFEMLLRQRQRRRGAAPTSPAADVPDKPVPAVAAAS